MSKPKIYWNLGRQYYHTDFQRVDNNHALPYTQCYEHPLILWQNILPTCLHFHLYSCIEKGGWVLALQSCLFQAKPPTSSANPWKVTAGSHVGVIHLSTITPCIVLQPEPNLEQNWTFLAQLLSWARLECFPSRRLTLKEIVPYEATFSGAIICTSFLPSDHTLS